MNKLIDTLKSKDFWAGLLFVVMGLGFMVIARNYNFGSSARMGPAYFPMVLGGVLCFLGLIIGGRAFISPIIVFGAVALQPLGLVTLSIVLFAVSLEQFGLVVASLLLVFVGSFAGAQFKVGVTLLLWLVMVTFSIAVFHNGLGLPIPLWPSSNIVS